MNTNTSHDESSWSLPSNSIELNSAEDVSRPSDKPVFFVRFVASLVLIFPLWFGGNTLAAISIVKFLIFAVVCFSVVRVGLFSSKGEDQSFRLRGVARLFFLLAAIFAVVCLLQLLPLPVSLLKVISPGAAEVYQASGADVGRITLYFSQTFSDLFWLLALGLVFFGILSLPEQTLLTSVSSSNRKRLRGAEPVFLQARETDAVSDLLQRVLVWCGLLCSVIALSHWALQSELLYGLFAPYSDVPQRERAHWPFVNPDNLSVLLEVCCITAFARFLRFGQLRAARSAKENESIGSFLQMFRGPSRFGRQLPYGLAVILMVLAALLTLSRAGIALTFLGMACVWFAYRRLPLRRLVVARIGKHSKDGVIGQKHWMISLGVQAAILFSLFVLVLFFLGQGGRHLLANRIEYGLAAGYDQSRAALSQASLDIFWNYPLFGVGLGNWRYAAPRVIPRELAGWTLDFAHNDYLQLLAEVGIVGFLPFILAMGVFGTLSWRMFWGPLLPTQRFELLGSFIACAMVLIHSLVDFPWHVPGLALIIVVALAVHVRLLQRARVVINERKTV